MRKRNRGLTGSNDIAFLLIIFFLVLTGISSNQGIPVSYGSSSENEHKTTTITLNGDGSFTEIEHSLLSNKDVLIQVPPQLSWGKTIQAMDHIKEHNPASVRLKPL